MVVDKKTIIGDIIAEDMDAAECFFEQGMFCISCPVSQGESIEEACMVHGVDPDDLVDSLNHYFEEKKK